MARLPKPQIVVNEEGIPVQPVVVKEVASVLDQAAIDAILKQRFTPGKQRGRPVPVQIAIPVNFRLA